MKKVVTIEHILGYWVFTWLVQLILIGPDPFDRPEGTFGRVVDAVVLILVVIGFWIMDRYVRERSGR